MDILSVRNNQTSFNNKTFKKEKGNIICNDVIGKDDQNDDCRYNLNPLLNDSLNNLVKRLDRTKIPKPPPTKGQSSRKKSRLSNSLPNIFLPSGFEDNKYCNNDKKVQWTNKLNLNLDRLKSAFRDTYDNWYQHKSQSIPNLEVNSEETLTSLSSEIIVKDTKDGVNMTTELAEVCRKDSEGVQQNSLNKLGPWKGILYEKPIGTSGDASDIEDKPSYSTHVYLDGAIIEPISPASPAVINGDNYKITENEQKSIISDIDSIPTKKKKGRPKKVQGADITQKGGLKCKPTKLSLTKKEKKIPGNLMFSEIANTVTKDGFNESTSMTQFNSISDKNVSPKKHKKLVKDINSTEQKLEEPNIESTSVYDDPCGKNMNAIVIEKSETALIKKQEIKYTELNVESTFKNLSVNSEKPILTKKQLRSSKQGIVSIANNVNTSDNFGTIDDVADFCANQGHEKKLSENKDNVDDCEIVDVKSIPVSVNKKISKSRKTKSSKEDENTLSSVDLDKSFESKDTECVQQNSFPQSVDNTLSDQVISTINSRNRLQKSGKKSKAGVKPVQKNKQNLINVDEFISEVLSNNKSKPSRKGKLKVLINEEIENVPAKVNSEETPVSESLEMTVNKSSGSPVSRSDVVDDESIKHDFKDSTEQSNDIEVLSKSLTDSVDTSMLPPRKRYKRLMYLDNPKQNSPNNVVIVEDSQSVDDISDSMTLDSVPKSENEALIKKPGTNRSKLKRKKQTKSESIVTIEGNADVIVLEPPDENSDKEIHSKEEAINVPSIEGEVSDKPSSLKRSKREAAARGFANMVAMSLNSNNNAQAHETLVDSNKKIEATKEVTIEVGGNKIFKRPRKSLQAGALNLKNKGKSLKSFEFTDESDDETQSMETQKVIVKKQRNIKDSIDLKENPPSPGETIVSNNSSSQDTIKYRKIRTNTYIDQKPSHWSHEVEKCGCKPSSLKETYEEPHMYNKSTSSSKKAMKRTSSIVWDCTDNCLNRLTYTECNSKTCPCGDLCNNQKIKKQEWVTGLKVTDIHNKGRGVVTTKSICEGTLITEYVGEVITESTFQERMINLYKEDAHHYCLHLDGEMLIDAYRSGSVARFVNHSCQPNCEMQKWMVNGAYRMCLFASEDINPDTELTYDYNFCSFNTKMTQACLCGAVNCRGFIGGRPRAEQSESQKDRKKLFFAFGRILSTRERIFVIRRAIFLIRGRTLGRCRRLGIRRTKQTHGNKLPSTITEIKRRKAKKNQFLTQMSALNSIRSIRTRLLQNAQDNEKVTRTAQLAQILRDLYNTLLEQKDPLSPTQQLVAPFINSLKQKKYPEFYSMVGIEGVVSLNQVYSRLLDGVYTTMMSFDQDILQMMQNIELYAGKQSNIGKCAERMKPIYKDLKMNAIALYEALTDELIDDKDKNKLLSNNLTQVTNAVKSLTINSEIDLAESCSQPKNKKRKQTSSSTIGSFRGRLERGAEVIKCVCGFLIEAGHVMVQCDRCFVWQHSYCMNVARSSELVDVKRMEPYYCHICLNIPTESLIREIPRHFVITDEIVDSGNTLFWTLLHSDSSLLKIDDFVYIASNDDSNLSTVKSKIRTSMAGSPQILDLSQRTIMRIYSLWKDSNGQRWMEGGLFLRPYNNYLQNLTKSKLNNSSNSSKRKTTSVIDLSSHKWHHHEVVYTDLTKILPLDVCIGRCHVLNNHTFKLGKPLIQSNNNTNIDDVYLCDWLINKDGEWSEIDPAYLKINTKPYCFERYLDGLNCEANNDKFLRQYTADELLKFDQGSIESCSTKNSKMKSVFSQEEKKVLRTQMFQKLITKLSEFAYEKSRKLPLSPPSSIGSRSAASSRGASPQCDNAGSKSPIIQHEEYYPHYSRKQSCPRKSSTENVPTTSNVNKILNDDCKPKTIPSEYSECSPKLMIVVDDDRISREENIQKVTETPQSTNSDIVSSSPKENLDDRSNPCSEIKYGDLLDLLKESVKSKPLYVKDSKNFNKKSSKKGKKRTIVKKSVIKAVSEINSVDDNWVPTKSRLENAAPRRETRSRKATSERVVIDGKESEDEVAVDIKNSIVEDTLDAEDESGGPKTCFVKLERIRVTRAEKMKHRKVQDNLNLIKENEHKTTSISISTCQSDLKTPSIEHSQNIHSDPQPEIIVQETPAYNEIITSAEENETQNQPSSLASNNRSKRKKGVPKRIPFDSTFQASTVVKTADGSADATIYEYEVVDLSSGKCNQTDKPDQTTTDCQKIESPEICSSTLAKQPKPNILAIEARHITAANDFSSIENISSN